MSRFALANLYGITKVFVPILGIGAVGGVIIGLIRAKSVG